MAFRNPLRSISASKVTDGALGGDYQLTGKLIVGTVGNNEARIELAPDGDGLSLIYRDFGGVDTTYATLGLAHQAMLARQFRTFIDAGRWAGYAYLTNGPSPGDGVNNLHGPGVGFAKADNTFLGELYAHLSTLPTNQQWDGLQLNASGRLRIASGYDINGLPVATLLDLIGDLNVSGVTTTKLAASDAPWTTYTPVWTGGTVGNGTLTGRYCVVGGILHCRIKLVWGSTTTSASANWAFSLPVNLAATLTPTNAAIGEAQMHDSSAGLRYRGVARGGSTTTVGVLHGDGVNNLAGNTVPFTWAVSDELSIVMAGLEVA